MNHKTLMAQGPVDVNVSHKTGWFPRYVTPVRTGWYQGNFDRFWYWDGKNWNKHGYITGIFGVVKGPDAWRGLTANIEVQGQDEAQLRTVPLERPVGRKEG